MTDYEKQRAEELILEWLRSAPAPQDVRDLFSRSAEVPVPALERAVWYLVDEGRASFTNDWKLSLAENAA
ncbi:MAG TPA: hypothetical protein VGB92_02290 [Longimicrobium sp.]|jgi:hypothetical protein